MTLQKNTSLLRRLRQMTQLVATLALLAGLSGKALGQSLTTAAVNGQISDARGEALVGVTVVATHDPTGSKYGTVTRGDGRYNLPSVRVGGPYTINVSYVGYKRETRKVSLLQLGQNLQLDFKLSEESTTTEEIVVTAERSSVLSAERTGAATTVSKELVESLPTVSRSISDFARVTPQVTVGQFGGITVAGRNPRYNNIQIDGSVLNDVFGLADAGTPGGLTGTNPISLDAIQEFQISLSPFDVRQGGFSGASINAITRAGTNKFEGSLYFFGRDQNLTGLSADGLSNSFGRYSDIQAGFRVGGPLIENKFFFFINAEWANRVEPAFGISQYTVPGQNASTSAARFARILDSAFSYNAGTAEEFSAVQPGPKVTARFDYNLDDNNRLTLRTNLVVAGRDRITANGRSQTQFGLSNYNHYLTSTTSNTVLQLNSSFGSNSYNELRLGFTANREKRNPAGAVFPEITVNLTTPTSGTASNPTRELRAGNEFSSQKNSLDLDLFELRDDFTIFAGAHTFTVGTQNEFFGFNNLFIQAAYGSYGFTSLNNLEARLASSYTYRYAADPANNPEPRAKFGVRQFGFYVQDEWKALPNLNFTIGVRADIPTYSSAPAYNSKVETAFGLRTDAVPTGILLSPRVGFNWDVSRTRTTQLRGGGGVFTGRVPYVWISNNYTGTGLEFNVITAGQFGQYNGNTASPFNFNPDPFNQPTPATNANLATGVTTTVNLLDKDFRFPQLARGSLALDQQLPLGIIGTAEVLYGRNLNEAFYQNINIVPTGQVLDPARDGRPLYAAISGSGFGTRNRVNYDQGITDAWKLGNTSDGYSLTITGQLQREFSNGLTATLAYTYGQAKDRSGITSSVAQSNYQNNATFDPNSPTLSTSIYEVQHRVVAAATYSFEIGKDKVTTISLFYNGQAGAPFSYTYGGDANGDGISGNDLVYVPRDASDIILTSNNFAALDAFIEGDEGLRTQRGKIMERNTSRGPWNQRIDLSINQGVPFLGTNLQLRLDVFNVLNLLSNSWGRQSFPNERTNLLTFGGFDAATGRPAYSFSTATTQNTNVGAVGNDLTSRWQAQLSARLSF